MYGTLAAVVQHSLTFDIGVIKNHKEQECATPPAVTLKDIVANACPTFEKLTQTCLARLCAEMVSILPYFTSALSSRGRAD